MLPDVRIIALPRVSEKLIEFQTWDSLGWSGILEVSMKQESVAYDLICPNCGNSGPATIFEDHNPIRPSRITRRVETLPKGMVGGAIDQAGDQQIICEACDTIVPIAR
jgi:hypothetical protein